MAKVEMYTKAFCPFCIRAKSLLKNKGVEFIDIPAAMDRKKRKEMNERSGRNTFPQIFIDGKHIGCLLYTSPSPRDRTRSRMPSSA